MMLRRFAALTQPSTLWTSAALLLLALVGVGISTASPEAVVTQHFTAALEQTPSRDSRIAGRDQPLISGSEAYWLAERRRHEADGATLEPVTWAPPLLSGVAVGDRITVSTGGAERVLQIIAISDVEAAPGTSPATASPPAARQIAVTCRDVTTRDGRLVTFLAPAGAAAQDRRAGRTL